MTDKALDAKVESRKEKEGQFEKWVQEPVANYSATQVGEEWEFYLSFEGATSSTGPNISREVSEIIKVASNSGKHISKDRQLIDEWLAISEETFSFWDNEQDSAYDEL